LTKIALPGLDKGGADLIASGAIKIKQGVAPEAFTSDALSFTDGSQLKAHVVILAYASPHTERHNITHLILQDRL
jgi:hypothetical protein